MWIWTIIACGGATGDLSISAPVPELACASSGATITLSGSGVAPLVVNALESAEVALPGLLLRPRSALDGSTTELPELELGPTHPALSWLDEQTLTVQLALLGADPAVYEVVALRPEGGEVVADGPLAISGAPQVLGLDPDELCQQGDATTVTLSGEQLLVVDGVAPVVTVGGDPVEVTPGACVPLAEGLEGSVCTTLELAVTPSTQALGDARIEVTNPGEHGCGSTGAATLELASPPTLSAAVPDALCIGGGTFELEGSGFDRDSTVQVGGLDASVTWRGSGLVEVELPEGLSAGPAEVTLSVPNGCSVTEELLTLTEAPLAWAIDPPVLPVGVGVEATAWVADVSGELTEVWLQHTDGTVAEVAWSWDPDVSGRFDLSVPSDLAVGSWELWLVQDESCSGRSGASLEIRDSFGLRVDEVSPGHAWTFATTPIEVRGAGFVDPVRLWLVDDEQGASPLYGVGVRSDELLAAVVPYDVEVGVYDLMALGGDGSLGLLANALEVTWDAPPVITAVSPVTLSTNGELPLEVEGQDFRDPELWLHCSDGASLPGTLTASDYGYLEAELDVGGHDGAVCVVEVVNADGMTAEHASVSITNPAQNLADWEVGPALGTARRAPLAVAGRTTSTERWAWAIGGDLGDESTATTLVEQVGVDAYGELGSWTPHEDLPVPRTLAAGVSLDGFVYLVGGHDGSTPVDTVLRAEILDPLDVPVVEELSVAGDGGLSGGSWTWRIAALYPADHTTNPGGESLPGEPVAASLPEGEAWDVTLSWTELDGAEGYRVYRTDESGVVGWVADVEPATFTDVGDDVDAGLTPLSIGSLGSWAELEPLSTERQAPCLAAVRDPRQDPERVHLVVAGGRDASGAVLDSIEIGTVSLEGDPVLDPWVLADEVLADARERCGGFAVDATLHTVVDEDAWVYFAGGEDDQGAIGTVEAGQVLEGGTLDQWQEIRSMSPKRSGFAAVAASDFLYVAGGQNASASTGGVSAKLEASDFPDVQNWNSLGTSLSVARYLPGTAWESSVLLVVGGIDDAGACTDHVDVSQF